MKKIFAILLFSLCFFASCTESKYDFSSQDNFNESLYAQAEKEGLDKSTVDKAMEAFFELLEDEFSSDFDALEADIYEASNKLMSEEVELSYELSKAKSSEEAKVFEEKLNELTLRRKKEIEGFSVKYTAKLLSLCKKKFNNRNLKNILNL